MAMICRYKTEHGVPLQRAYVQIRNIHLHTNVLEVDGIERNSHTLTATAQIFYDEASRRAGRPAIATVEIQGQHDESAPAYQDAYRIAGEMRIRRIIGTLDREANLDTRKMIDDGPVFLDPQHDDGPYAPQA